jgi:hypothetical protein
MAERSIAGTDLMRMLPELLEEVAQRGTVFLVSIGKASESGGIISGLVSATSEIVFALGSPQVLGGVFGLIDEEYGWPHPIQISEVKTVSDLMPGYRRHPMIYHGSDCLAMSISVGEYELLKQQ